MARLDRLGPAKEIAQLGATIGREFSYELMAAVSLLDEETLQHGLKQLVEAELVYQRGLLPQAHYLFKHALIQDTAYQALLKSTRQQSHRQIAQVNAADPRVDCLSFAAVTLWLLGYPDQALKRSHEALDLAEGLSHPFSLAFALGIAAAFHSLRWEG